MDLKEAAGRSVIAKPVASRPTISNFRSFSELLADSTNGSPSSEPTITAIRPKTVRFKPVFNSPSVESGNHLSDTILKSNHTSPLIYKPLAKSVSRTTISLLANMGAFNASNEQIAAQNLQMLTPMNSRNDKRPQSNTNNNDQPSYDGYNWRKYGQKQVKGSEYPRSYYKCTHPNCAVRKKVGRSIVEEIAEIVYKGEHNHSKPRLPRRHVFNCQSLNIQINDDNDVFGSSSNLNNLVKLQESSNHVVVTETADDEPPSKTRKIVTRLNEKFGEGLEEPQVVVHDGIDPEAISDGFRWRKYGQKVVKGNPYPRSGVKCIVRKHVERASDDPSVFITTYEDSFRSNPVSKTKEGIKDGGSAAQTFTFRELAAATKNFRPDCLLGEGGFGRVYKGRLETSNQIVAIKQLDRNGLQGNREFLVEVLMLGLLHHPNLVNLIGYCADGDQRLLVYEYMCLGSLDDHLHDPSPGKKRLDWNTRMKIAAGAAKGLEYLHDKASPPVIYRDLKCSNILLGESYHPKLSDFGLAKVGPVGDNTHVSTRVMGTYGYCAPEYAMTGQLTLKSDVYSFGVVLLEIITGRKAIDNSKAGGEQNLVAWARPLFKDRRKFGQIADPELQGQYPSRGLYQALAVAAMCVQEQPNMRPVIADVVTALSYLASQKYDPETQPIQNSRWSPTTPPRSRRDIDKRQNGGSGSVSGSDSVSGSEKNYTKRFF